MTVNCIILLVGIPFLKQTRHVRNINLSARSKTRLVMNMDAKTPDAPYSDTFVIREAWIAVSKGEDD